MPMSELAKALDIVRALKVCMHVSSAIIILAWRIGMWHLWWESQHCIIDSK